MNIWFQVFLGFAAIIVIRVLINVYRLYRLHIIYKNYLAWAANDNYKFGEQVIELISLFKAADVKDASIPIVQPAGYSLVSTSQASAFQNAGNLREEFVAHIIRSFDRARGVFKHNIAESFNPIFWIMFVVFLPQRILVYLNVKESSISIRIFQVLWWLVAPAAIIFRDKLYSVIAKLIQ